MAIVSLGAMWNGPFMHNYFNFLESRFPQAGGFRNLLTKIAINQLFMNTSVYLPLFYTWTGYVYGRSMDETLAKARREYMPSLQATWAIFTPVNFLNFYLTPVRHQVTVNIVVSFVYNTTLSFIAGEGFRAHVARAPACPSPCLCCACANCWRFCDVRRGSLAFHCPRSTHARAAPREADDKLQRLSRSVSGSRHP